jgi:transposase InsO family protein
MSRPANPYENAACESFIKTLKQEEIRANQYRDLDDLRTHIEEFIDRYYNHRFFAASVRGTGTFRGRYPPECLQSLPI